MTIVKMILKPFKMIMKMIKGAFKTPMRTMFSIMFVAIALIITVVIMRKTPEQFTNEQAEELNPINNKKTVF